MSNKSAVVATTIRTEGEHNSLLVLSQNGETSRFVDSELITWNVYELAKNWPFASNTTNKYTFDVK